MEEMNLNILCKNNSFNIDNKEQKKQCNTNKLTNKNMGKSSK